LEEIQNLYLEIFQVTEKLSLIDSPFLSYQSYQMIKDMIKNYGSKKFINKSLLEK